MLHTNLQQTCWHEMFLNTRKLYEHIENVKANHNICASYVIFLAETRLVHSDDNKKYEIPGFEV